MHLSSLRKLKTNLVTKKNVIHVDIRGTCIYIYMLLHMFKHKLNYYVLLINVFSETFLDVFPIFLPQITW